MAVKVDLGIIITALNQAGPGLRSASTDVERLGRASDATAGRLRAIQVVIAGILITKAIQLGRAFVDAAGGLQALQIRLAGVTGSFKQADVVFADLQKRFASAPFDLAKIADGFVRVASSGLDLEKTNKLTNAIVNAVAAFGGGTAELERTFIGFSQVLGKGSLQMEELRQQIGEQVPVALRLMATEAHKTTAQFIQDVSNGMVSGEQAVKLFTEGSEKLFGNFAEKLSSTIPGAIGRIQQQFTAGLKGLLDRTDVGARLAVIFNNLADRIKEFMDGINQSQIDKFFSTLSSIEETSGKLITLLSRIGPIIVNISQAILGIVNALPDDAIEYGVIGYVLFGKKGAAIGALIAGVDNALTGLQQKMARGQDSLFNSIFGTDVHTDDKVKGLFSGISDLYGHFFGSNGEIASKGNGGLQGTAKQIKETQANVEALGGAIKQLDPNFGFGVQAQKSFTELQTLLGQTQAKATGALAPFLDDMVKFEKKVGTISQGFTAEQARIKELSGKGSLSPIEGKELAELQTNMGLVYEGISKARANMGSFYNIELTKFRDGITDVVTRVQANVETFKQAASGNELEQRISGINQKTQGWTEQLQNALDKSLRLNESTGKEGATIASIRGLIEEANSARDMAIAKETELYKLQTQQFQISEQKNQLESLQKITDLQRQQNTNIGFQISQGTTAGKLLIETDNMRRQLQIESLDIQDQILAKQEELTNTADPARRESINQTIGILNQMNSATQNAMDNLNAQAGLETALWQQVGQTIEDSLGGAIAGIITGTKTWKEIGLDLFNSLTRAASEYIAKLIIMNAVKAAGSAFGGGFADGGVFSGSIKPFADGGIISGPTLFGLAGEAGTEAIMPLERVGGKLGVRSVGGGDGGGQTHIHLNAVDTQTGVQFLFRHRDDISTLLRQANALNKGVGRMAV